MSKIDVVTLGCRLNIVESETMRALAHDAGLSDTVIVNSCAVTAEAARQSRQAVRRALRGRPGATVVATGCATEIDTQAFGGERILRLPNARKTDPRAWAEMAGQSGVEPDPAARSDFPAGRTRGFLAIQNGCDHHCTFCIIPFGRGPSRSLPQDDVVAGVRTLVAAGHADVILTGVDLTSWGGDLPDRPSLGSLVRAILTEVPGLKRLRLSSLDCIEADEGLIEAFASEERLMPHLHLSLQSGDDLILKRMKRRHGRADAIRFCEKLRIVRPDIVFGADFIVGFPTETEVMFERTLALVDEAGLTHLHVFPYSARPGTAAARMPVVDGTAIRARAARLRDTGMRRLRMHLDGQIGKTLEILAERGGLARARDFTAVRIGSLFRPGTIARVRIAGHDGQRLLAAELEA